MFFSTSLLVVLSRLLLQSIFGVSWESIEATGLSWVIPTAATRRFAKFAIHLSDCVCGCLGRA